MIICLCHVFEILSVLENNIYEERFPEFIKCSIEHGTNNLYSYYVNSTLLISETNKTF